MKFSLLAISATVTFWKDTHAFFFFFSLPPPSDRDTISANYFHACSFTELHASATLAADSLVYSRTRRLCLCRLFISWFQPPASPLVLFLSPLASPAPSSNSPSLVAPPPRPLHPCLVSSRSAFPFSLSSLPLSVPFLISPASPLDLSPCQPTSPPVVWLYLASVLFLVSPHWQLYLPLWVAASPLSIHPRFTFLSGRCPRHPPVQHLPLERHCVRESLWQSACEDLRNVLNLKPSTLDVCPACFIIVAKPVLFWCVCLVFLSVCLSSLCSLGPTYSQTRGLDFDLGCLSSILRSPEGEAC